MADIPRDVDARAAAALRSGSPRAAFDDRGTLPPPLVSTPSASLCSILGAVLRLAFTVSVVLALVAGAAELGLRAAGARQGGAVAPANTIPDGWTGFRLRPGVSGQEIDLTNDLGMHAPRSYPLVPPAGVTRVAVLGSSVVYGLGVVFADTIPGAVERALQAEGQRAEVLNFGTHAFSIVNVSALLQAYVHQFQPEVVVVVVDLQIALPRWPSVHPTAETDQGSQKLDAWQALLKRGAPRSALLTLFDDPRPARRWIRRATGLPLKPRMLTTGDGPPEGDAVTPAATPVSRPTAAPPESIPAYEQRRERELGAPLAAMAAFCAEEAIALYFVTPYGPYFDVTEDELARMSVHHFLEEPTRVHGVERIALGAEVELITRVVRRVAAAGGAHVVDMLGSSRRSSLRTSPDFTEDGVHLSPIGNVALGKLIATRIVQDLRPQSGDRD